MIRCKSPLRISFGGGGTDISPYKDIHGGLVLSVTIDRYTYCTLTERQDNMLTVRSLDYGISTEFDTSSVVYDGELDLVKAVVKVLDIHDGFDLYLHSDAAPGSGLGSSSSLTVSLLGAFNRHYGYNFDEHRIAELAYQVERVELGISGGFQDQYAASFGGLNVIEFNKDDVMVNPLDVSVDTINELEYRLLLCNTGKTRRSDGIIDDQVQRYVQGEDEASAALARTKEIALEMKSSLIAGDIDKMGSLLNEAWNAKKKFSPKITSSQIDELYADAITYGALGGKLLGAGGGGHLLFLCKFDKKHVIAAVVANRGAVVSNVAFDFRGMRSWQIKNG